jgi:hypothetical protein
MTDWLLGEEAPQRALPRGVTYDAAAHRYFLDGCPIPGVTSVLEETRMISFECVPEDVRKAAAQRGTLVHEMCGAIVGGTYKQDAFPQPLHKFAPCYENFLRRTRISPRYVEHLVVSRKLRFGGQLDLEAIFNDAETIFDVKTGGHHKSYRLQTAGYDIAFCEQEKRAPQKRYVTLLTGDMSGGKDGYKLVDHNDRQDLDVFRIALFLCNWKTNER